MRHLPGVILLLAVSSVNGQQTQYTVLLEDVTLEYVNTDYADMDAGLFDLNQTTKAVNATLTLKADLPDDTKISVKALKWHKNEYRYGLIQVQKRLKSALEMQTFGIQTVCLESIRPPAVWPLRKNVPYRLMGWVPDSSTYPPNVPDGKWKFHEIVTLSNKTQLLVANWFVRIQYKK